MLDRGLRHARVAGLSNMILEAQDKKLMIEGRLFEPVAAARLS